MDKKQILEKIKKCLALSKSANEHEAAAALAKARTLMDEYNVTEKDVLISEVKEKTAKGSGISRPNGYEVGLANAVADAFQCVVLFVPGLRTSGWKFIGVDVSPEIAQFSFDVLFRKLRSSRTEYIKTRLKRCKQGTKIARADMFCRGWVTAVHREVRRFAKADEQTQDKIKLYQDDKYPALRTTDGRVRKSGRKADDDFVNGIINGAATKLHHGVGGTDVKELK